MTIDDERWKAFVVILRAYARLRADHMLLLGMVVKSELDQTPVENWQENLERLQKRPEYAAQIEETERLIGQAETEMTDNDLIETISKLPPPDYLV